MSNTGVYLTQDKKAITATVKTLRHFCSFLKSDKDLMIDPYTVGWFERTLNKTQAKQKLHFLVLTAINRKAGIPDIDDTETVIGNRLEFDGNRNYNIKEM